MSQMPPKSSITNPFLETDDWFSEVVKLDKNVMQTSKSQFQAFLKSQAKSQTMTNANPWSLSNLIRSFSQHLILASVVSIVIISSCSAVAAQAFAPNKFKPTTIYQDFVQKFQSNKQVERNPFTALKPDDQNNVFSYDSCGLSVKYPKKIGDHQIDPLRNASDKAYRPNIIDSVQLTDVTDYFNNIQAYSREFNAPKTSDNDGSDYTTKQAKKETNPYRPLNISCFTIGSRATLGDTPQNGTTLTKEDLRDKVGWFIHEGNLKNIRTNNAYFGGIELTFEYGNKAYNVSFTDPQYTFQDYDIMEKEYQKNGLTKFVGIYGDQIQLQFNDLVESQKNTPIQTQPSSKTDKDIAEVPANSYNYPTNILPDNNQLNYYEKPGEANGNISSLKSAQCANATPSPQSSTYYQVLGEDLNCFVRFSLPLPAEQFSRIQMGLRLENSLGKPVITFGCKFNVDTANARGEYDGTVYTSLECLQKKPALARGIYEELISFDDGKTFEIVKNQTVEATADSSGFSVKPEIIVVENRFSEDKKSYKDLESVVCDDRVQSSSEIRCSIRLNHSITPLEIQVMSLTLRRETSIPNRPVMTPFDCRLGDSKISDINQTIQCTIQPEKDVLGTLAVDFVAFGKTIENVSRVTVIQ